MLVLASNSPRRKQLLALGGWNFMIAAPQVDERPLPGEAPEEYVLRLALTKAEAALGLLGETDSMIIVAADTTVVADLPDKDDPTLVRATILGKPNHTAEAEQMLRALRGRTHRVYTGLAALRAADGKRRSALVVTEVLMRPYSDEEIMAYIASGDPMDKAGAYAIQHADFHPVQNLQGCYANVMGLPLCHLAQMLAQLGLESRKNIFEACQLETGVPCQVYLDALHQQ
jgi:MAF protein